MCWLTSKDVLANSPGMLVTKYKLFFKLVACWVISHQHVCFINIKSDTGLSVYKESQPIVGHLVVFSVVQHCEQVQTGGWLQLTRR